MLFFSVFFFVLLLLHKDNAVHSHAVAMANVKVIVQLMDPFWMCRKSFIKVSKWCLRCWKSMLESCIVVLLVELRNHNMQCRWSKESSWNKVCNQDVINRSYKVVKPNVEYFNNRDAILSTNIHDGTRVVQRSYIIVGMSTTQIFDQNLFLSLNRKQNRNFFKKLKKTFDSRPFTIDRSCM